MNRSVVALSVLALLSAGPAAACSKNSAPTAESASSTAPAASSAPQTAAAAKPKGHTGDSLTLTRADGSTITVTLEQIISPATVTGGGGDPTKTYLATKLKITDPGTAAIDGDVNINVSVVGSDDQSYTADLNDVSECTNFESGAFHLSPGESATGCVVFALPHGVSPARVKYLPSAGFADDFGEWVLS
ncbi:hypothetical protein KIH27_00460 [Mycobacterium sp. M1]|uniref:DUF4352 domain-containing protein n=1 Tax=Mycolicibacter acidiphilus TaxID=2835306 RepID=A0ABS5RCQ1_9MYCO|nr:hypothetical protein [Mycolicibacter acidiphilus]MBS9532057.1 hypothetical protein [Mycolicibacter acidiphilus]